MSDGELISHPVGDVTAASAKPQMVKTEPAKTEAPVEIAKTEAPVEAPKVESPAIQPSGEEIAQVTPVEITPVETAPVSHAPTIEPLTETVETAPIGEIPPPEPKLPPVAQLAEPIARLVEPRTETAPPDFLREHTTRTIAAKPPLRAEPKPSFRPKLAPKPESKPETKTEPKSQRPRETPRVTRFALLAASVAICAGIGSALGSAGIASLSRFSAPAPIGTAADMTALREQIAQLAADLAATRTNVEHINRNSGTQFGKIVERFDRAERGQADPAAKLAKISETLDKVEKRLAALPTMSPTASTTANDVTGSVTPRPAPEAKTPPKPKVLEEFSLRRVYDGVALVEGRMGVIELVPGGPLPGGGRVEDIKREDGHWVVVTSRGLIISQR